MAAFCDGEMLIKKIAAVALRKRGADLGLKVLLEGHIEAGLGLGHIDAGQQPPDDLQPLGFLHGILFRRKPILSGKHLGLHAERHPNIRSITYRFTEEGRRRDTDDVEGGLAEAELAAKNRSLPSKTALPEVVADHRDGVGVPDFVNVG